MKIVLQRVKHASVAVQGQIVGEIEQGLLILLGITHDDNKANADQLVKKIVNLRVFNDSDNKMNLSIADIRGSFLVISQFTLYANCKKGNRPSYIEAAHPEIAKPLYEYFIENLKVLSKLAVEQGVFGAMMDIEFINDGPVTIIINS
jgi:D-tyrosyl-tRNA(Tyr) deacylase